MSRFHPVAQQTFRSGHRRRIDLALSVVLLAFLFLFAAYPPVSTRLVAIEDPEFLWFELVDPPPEIVVPDPPPPIRSPRVDYTLIVESDPVSTPIPEPLGEEDDSAPRPPAPPARASEKFTVFDRAPKPIRVVPPEYPSMARAAGIEGGVVCDVTVGTDGAVVEIVVVSSDAELFVEPALEALVQWVFVPAQQSGEPVRAKVRIPIRFRLSF